MEINSDFYEPSEEEYNHTLYGERALWSCLNKNTGFTTHINGALANVLKKYPNDYELKLLQPQG